MLHEEKATTLKAFSLGHTREDASVLTFVSRFFEDAGHRARRSARAGGPPTLSAPETRWPGRV